MSDQFPPFIGNSSVFLVKSDKPMATAFVVAIRDNSQGTSRALYLVTARHNLERAGYDAILTVRHNMRNQKFIERHYKVEQFIQHSSTDIAVVPLNIASKGFDAAALNQTFIDDWTMLRRDEVDDGNILAGSDVCVISMFPKHTGIDVMQPIWRFGKIAMIPMDKVVVDVGATRQAIEAILIEAMVWPGASGAPVFVNRSGTQKTSIDKVPLRLLGLISSHFETPTRDKTSKALEALTKKIANNAKEQGESTNADTTEEQCGEVELTVDKVHLNTGISVVIPAFQIREFVLQIHKESGGWMPENTEFWKMT